MKQIIKITFIFHCQLRDLYYKLQTEQGNLKPSNRFVCIHLTDVMNKV